MQVEHSSILLFDEVVGLYFWEGIKNVEIQSIPLEIL